MDTTTLKVTGINHVVLHVADVERSARFYEEVLGFEGRFAGGGPGGKMRFLRCGSQGLDLFEVAPGDVHGGQEMNHMALNVAGDNLDEIMAELAKVGVTTSDRTPRNTVFVTDPDGHRIEILPSRPAQAPTEQTRSAVST
ncbi:MAG: VOC family protein [Acidimicrobiales bacterium]|nr:VOC family protein [Acidimicrobiales bacterium]MBO0893623.1 VOC family protein [Acidimicrobiales bacterium]